jgi:hypothetical protein
MRNKSASADDDPLDREIDFSNGRPNPYWLGAVDRRCVRLIDRDLVEFFPDDESVNRALRGIANVAKRSAATAVAKRSRKKDRP